MLIAQHRLFLPIFIATLTLCSLTSISAQENSPQLVNDQQAVLHTLQRYHDALQALTTDGTFELFTDDAQVYEQSGVEGAYTSKRGHPREKNH